VDLLGLPPTNEHPLHQYRQDAYAEEARAAEDDRPHIEVDQTGARRDPLVASGEDKCAEVGISEEEQELQRSAQDVLRRAGRCRHLD
jgi:hypothetical protein